MTMETVVKGCNIRLLGVPEAKGVGRCHGCVFDDKRTHLCGEQEDSCGNNVFTFIDAGQLEKGELP
jgi:hypothetical protein